MERLKKKSHMKYLGLMSKREQEMENCDKLRNTEIKEELRT